MVSGLSPSGQAGATFLAALLRGFSKDYIEDWPVVASKDARCLMTIPPKFGRLTGVGAAAVIAALDLGTTILAPAAAKAAIFVGFGFGFPGYYYPPYPYYPPPPPPYYTPRAYDPPTPASYQPSAGYQPPVGHTPSGSAAVPSITYTSRPGWTNAEGQFCREYKSNQGVGNRATERYGTACRDASGQWRIVN
jgi:hypothetical protein